MVETNPHAIFESGALVAVLAAVCMPPVFYQLLLKDYVLHVRTSLELAMIRGRSRRLRLSSLNRGKSKKVCNLL